MTIDHSHLRWLFNLTFMTDEFYMHKALKEARKAYDNEEVPVGAVIIMNNKIIARGYNQVEKLKDSTAHAEIIALTAAFSHLSSKYLPGAIIYITVEPCLMCAGALYWSKIGKIIYGADDVKNGYKKYLSIQEDKTAIFPFHPKTTLINGVLKEECSWLMKDFFKSKR